MNMRNYAGLLKRLRYRALFQLRLLDINKQSNSFSKDSKESIQRIYAINLDRKPKRWRQVSNELKRIKSRSGSSLFELSRRFSAIDARYLDEEIDSTVLYPYFTLADQLQVEPNPFIKIDVNSKVHKIKMTPQEVAIALSHIHLWQKIASDDISYTLVLEDDVYFEHGFANSLDDAWSDIISKSSHSSAFDILFLSFQEVGIKSHNKIHRKGLVHRPDYGIWQASGYVLSKDGAQKLLNMFPVYGPIDLWLNLQFSKLDIFLINKPIIEQRVDVPSTNSYSIMPVLSQIGVYNHDSSLVTHRQNLPEPIFAFGNPGSGLTSLALALSVLGYTCCSDLTELPTDESHNLFTKKRRRHFNAYVNIGQLSDWPVSEIFRIYPKAKIIYTTPNHPNISDKILNLPQNYSNKWDALCSFLKCEYPSPLYPNCIDIGQRKINIDKMQQIKNFALTKKLRVDMSPWIISQNNWTGIAIQEDEESNITSKRTVVSWNGENSQQDKSWKLRNDTFPSNLSIFKPDNVKILTSNISSMTLREQITSVRNFTSAAIVTRQKFLYGRYIAEIKPANASGLITGMFLHRNSPHQEIDIEFLGKDTSKMLVNVFYNPGVEGAKLEYGYRGTPVLIDLGFDASKEFHLYEIEWSKHVIRWFVDKNVVYERVLWDPTPIPNLPMEFNINLWYSRSKELAGKLDISRIPAISYIGSVMITQ